MGQIMPAVDPLQSIAFLGIVSALAVVYSVKRAVVLLPALILASLLSRMFGLAGFEPLFALSTIALSLLVFVAGMELDVRLMTREKERVLLIFFFEMAILLSLISVLRFGDPFFLTLLALSIASNEKFVLEAAKDQAKIGQYGILLSVLEDSMAVFLLSIGFFAGRDLPPNEFYTLIALTMVVAAVAVTAGVLFNRVLRIAHALEARVLICLLYLMLMIAAAEAFGLPEALVAFLGGVGLALGGVDHETRDVMDGYMALALMGFVMSLPYTVEFPAGLSILKNVALGAVMAAAAFLLRAGTLMVASALGGMRFGDAVTLSLSLANTGEFGLLAAASLAAEGVLTQDCALTAMFAYAFNLTLVSAVVRRMDRIRESILSGVPSEVVWGFNRVAAESESFLLTAVRDEDFKAHLYQLAMLTGITYAASGLAEAIQADVPAIFMTILSTAASLMAIYVTMDRLGKDLSSLGYSPRSLLSMALRLALIYAALAPLLQRAVISPRFLWEASHPVTLPAVLVTAVLLDRLLEKVTDVMRRGWRAHEISRLKGEEPGGGPPDQPDLAHPAGGELE